MAEKLESQQNLFDHTPIKALDVTPIDLSPAGTVVNDLKELEFPAVTVCSLHILNTSLITEEDADDVPEGLGGLLKMKSTKNTSDQDVLRKRKKRSLDTLKISTPLPALEEVVQATVQTSLKTQAEKLVDDILQVTTALPSLLQQTLVKEEVTKTLANKVVSSITETLKESNLKDPIQGTTSLPLLHQKTNTSEGLVENVAIGSLNTQMMTKKLLEPVTEAIGLELTTHLKQILENTVTKSLIKDIPFTTSNIDLLRESMLNKTLSPTNMLDIDEPMSFTEGLVEENSIVKNQSLNVFTKAAAFTNVLDEIENKIQITDPIVNGVTNNVISSAALLGDTVNSLQQATKDLTGDITSSLQEVVDKTSQITDSIVDKATDQVTNSSDSLLKNTLNSLQQATNDLTGDITSSLQDPTKLLSGDSLISNVLDVLDANLISNIIRNLTTQVVNNVVSPLNKSLVGVVNQVTDQILKDVISQISNLPETLSTRLLEDVTKLDLTGNILQINDILGKLQDTLENTVLSKVLDLTGLNLKNLVSSVLELVPNLLNTLVNDRLSRNDFKKYGIRAQDFIRGCLIDQKVCSYRNFSVWQNEQYGNCFTFNDYSNKDQNFIKKISNKFGSVYGLRLLLKISNRQENVPFYSPQSGVRVVVHSPSEIAFPEDSGVDIPPRMTGTISVEKREIHRLERPHGICSYESDVEGWKLVADKFNYSKSACLKACRTKQILTNCNCALSMRLAEFMDQDAEMCPVGEVDKCVNNQLVSENCTCDPGCREHQYKTTAAYSLMNEDHLCVGDLMGILGTDSEGGLCGENTETLVGVHVYLKDLTVEVVAETPTYTITSLLSNIGGTLGLFMGLSVITIIEIIELFLSLFVCCCTSSRKDKNSVSAKLVSPVGQTEKNSSSIKIPIPK